jgi:hypothetical protein
MAMYHEEPGQEDFLVLRGECLLIVEGEERPLAPWDFAHCPPRTKHVIVGAGTEPALVLDVGARKGQATYPADEAAVRHAADLEEATDLPAEAYARFSRPEEGPAPELRLLGNERQRLTANPSPTKRSQRRSVSACIRSLDHDCRLASSGDDPVPGRKRQGSSEEPIWLNHAGRSCHACL